MSDQNAFSDIERDTLRLLTLKKAAIELHEIWPPRVFTILNDPKRKFRKKFRVDSESFNSQKKHVLSDF